MDQKTLEWMTERVEKGQAIIKKIAELTRTAKNITFTDKVILQDKYGNGQAGIFSKDAYGSASDELMKEIRTNMIESINKEIHRLEQELAEL